MNVWQHGTRLYHTRQRRGRERSSEYKYKNDISLEYCEKTRSISIAKETEIYCLFNTNYEPKRTLYFPIISKYPWTLFCGFHCISIFSNGPPIQLQTYVLNTEMSICTSDYLKWYWFYSCISDANKTLNNWQTFSRNMFDNTKQFLIVYSFQTIKQVLLIMKLDEKYPFSIRHLKN